MMERQVTCLVSGMNMETYHGHVRTPADAIILFEACRIGLLPRVQRRLSEKERQSIRSGSIFVWDEREAGMRRWTDGKSWSASRVSGSFLTYREMEGKRGGSGLSTPLFSGNASKGGRESSKSADAESNDDGPDGYRYKPDGLMKQSFSITTSSGQHLHLISYYSRTQAASPNLMQPSNDAQLRHIRPEKGTYPESTLHDHNSIPPVTRGPMPGSAYPTASHVAPPLGSPYGRPPPLTGFPGYNAPGWAPPSPLHTPPPQQPPAHYQHYYGGHPSQPPPNYGHSPSHHQNPIPPYYQAAAYQSSNPYDRPPPPSSVPTLPPPLHQSLPTQSMPPYGHHHPATSVPTPQLPRLDGIQAQRSVSSGLPLGAGDNGSPRHDSVHPRAGEKQAPRKSTTPPLQLPSVGGASTTIPSITSLINDAQAAAEEHKRRANSLSPGSKKPLQDIPLHKIGFNPHSDARALRDLDKATFRA